MSVMQVLLHRFFAYRPCKPRSTLLRIGLGLVGLAVLALLVVFGLFIGLGMLLFAAVRRLMGRRPLSAEATPPASRPRATTSSTSWCSSRVSVG